MFNYLKEWGYSENFVNEYVDKVKNIKRNYLQIIKDEQKSCNTANKSSLCCTQVVTTKTFESYQSKRTFKIFQKLNSKSNFVIYLMECTLCKIQYVGKAGTSFNIWLNNHRQDANGNNPKAIPASIHFKRHGHNLKKHVNFTLIQQSDNTINTDIDTIKKRLKRREDFWILKLDTLKPKRLNQELNNV